MTMGPAIGVADVPVNNRTSTDIVCWSSAAVGIGKGCFKILATWIAGKGFSSRVI